MATRKPKEAPPEREQITTRILVIHRERLRALSTVKHKNENELLEDALELYWQSLSEPERTDAETVAKISRRHSPTKS